MSKEKSTLKDEYKKYKGDLKYYGFPRSAGKHHLLKCISLLDRFADKCDKLEKENAELRDFKEFVNMMIRRSLNHTCSDYEAIMAIDEKLMEQGE